jgi:hypothetical protein
VYKELQHTKPEEGEKLNIAAKVMYKWVHKVVVDRERFQHIEIKDIDENLSAKMRRLVISIDREL